MLTVPWMLLQVSSKMSTRNPLCLRRAEDETHKLLAYAVIRLAVAAKAGVGCC